MRKQLFLAVALLVLFSGAAFGKGLAGSGFDVNVIAPTTGTTYYPNMVESDKCIDFNFQVLDLNTMGPIHKASIFYNHNDGNKFMATDVNLDTTNCNFHGNDEDWNRQADCHIKYCFSTHKQYNGTYVMDVNVSGMTQYGTRYADANQVLTFTINNRFIDSSTESMINIVPVVLVAAIIIVAVLGIGGVLPGVLVITLLPALVIALIAILIFGGIKNILSGS